MSAKTILIVDDDAALTDNLEDILKEEGYLPFAAATYAQALDVAQERRPLAALLDLKLPDGLGTTLLAELKRVDPKCICTLMTAYADLDSALAAIQEGAFHYLQKPVSPSELLMLLERVFETIRLREEKRRAEEAVRESEEKFRMIFETADDCIFVKDWHLRYTDVNPSTEKLFSLPASQLIGKTDEDLLGQKEGAHIRQVDSRVLAGESVQEEHTRPVAGVPRTFDVIKVPIRDSADEIVGLCGIARDLTERRRLEAQLARAQKMEAVGTLAGGVAHDFNNLLQAIQGYAELLLHDRDKGVPEYEELQAILRAARRGGELTRQLLTFSRKVESKLRPVDLNQEVENARGLLVRTLPRMIDIELHLKGSIKPVNADPAQIEQVLLNLAVNARDAMPEGGEIVISTDEITLDDAFCRALPEIKPGEYVMLSVADTGGGMEQAMLERVFEPFYTTKEVGRGTGLGLAMVYGIVKNHGGHIVCRSQPSEWTTFEIYLPALEYAEIPSDAHAAEEFPRGVESILLVDDEASVSDVGKQMLEKFGYTVITAPDGESALEVYRKEQDRIALVILDLIMPGMGGRRCLAELLKRDPDIKVIIASGYSENGSVQESLEADARGFVGKPYEIGQMLRMIRRVLDEDVELGSDLLGLLPESNGG